MRSCVMTGLTPAVSHHIAHHAMDRIWGDIPLSGRPPNRTPSQETGGNSALAVAFAQLCSGRPDARSTMTLMRFFHH